MWSQNQKQVNYDTDKIIERASSETAFTVLFTSLFKTSMWKINFYETSCHQSSTFPWSLPPDFTQCLLNINNHSACTCDTWGSTISIFREMMQVDLHSFYCKHTNMGGMNSQGYQKQLPGKGSILYKARCRWYINIVKLSKQTMWKYWQPFIHSKFIISLFKTAFKRSIRTSVSLLCHNYAVTNLSHSFTSISLLTMHMSNIQYKCLTQTVGSLGLYF